MAKKAATRTGKAAGKKPSKTGQRGGLLDHMGSGVVAIAGIAVAGYLGLGIKDSYNNAAQGRTTETQTYDTDALAKTIGNKGMDTPAKADGARKLTQRFASRCDALVTSDLATAMEFPEIAGDKAMRKMARDYAVTYYGLLRKNDDGTPKLSKVELIDDLRDQDPSLTRADAAARVDALAAMPSKQMDRALIDLAYSRLTDLAHISRAFRQVEQVTGKKGLALILSQVAMEESSHHLEKDINTSSAKGPLQLIKALYLELWGRHSRELGKHVNIQGVDPLSLRSDPFVAGFMFSKFMGENKLQTVEQAMEAFFFGPAGARIMAQMPQKMLVTAAPHKFIQEAAAANKSVYFHQKVGKDGKPEVDKNGNRVYGKAKTIGEVRAEIQSRLAQGKQKYASLLARVNSLTDIVHAKVASNCGATVSPNQFVFPAQITASLDIPKKP